MHKVSRSQMVDSDLDPPWLWSLKTQWNTRAWVGVSLIFQGKQQNVWREEGSCGALVVFSGKSGFGSSISQELLQMRPRFENYCFANCVYSRKKISIAGKNFKNQSSCLILQMRNWDGKRSSHLLGSQSSSVAKLRTMVLTSSSLVLTPHTL